MSKRDIDRAAAGSYNDSVDLSQGSSIGMQDDNDGGGRTKTSAKKRLKKKSTKVKVSAIDSIRDSIDLSSLPSNKNANTFSSKKLPRH